MTYHAVVYTKKNCPKCRMTLMLLRKMNIPYQDCYYGHKDQPNMIDLDAKEEYRRSWSEKAIKKLQDKGVQSMPYVEIVDDDKSKDENHKVVVDSWSDFQPAKINGWAKKIK